MTEKVLYQRQWRIVKQRRKIGGPFYLQYGMYTRTPLSGCIQWDTRDEGDYKTRKAAIEGLRSFPLTWGPEADRSKLLG